MNMTSFFVELVVTGIHTALWIALVILSLVGFRDINAESVLTLNLALPILAIAYIMGIIVDRVADRLTFQRDRQIRNEFDVKGLPSFRAMRLYVLSKSKDVYEELEYTRSRMRITRAGIVNFPLTSLALLLFIWRQLDDALPEMSDRLIASALVVAVGLVLTLLSLQAWQDLTRTYTKHTIVAFQILQSGQATGEMAVKD